MLFYKILGSTTHKKVIQLQKFKTSDPTWNEKFELPYRSCSVLDIQDFLECIMKKLDALTDNLPIRI